MIHSSFLHNFRGWEDQSLDKTATVVYLTTSACYGSTTVSGCTTATYGCALWAPTGGEKLEPSQYSEITMWKLKLPHDAAISASNMVYVSGHKYEVKKVDDPKSYNTAIICDVELVR